MPKWIPGRAVSRGAVQSSNSTHRLRCLGCAPPRWGCHRTLHDFDLQKGHRFVISKFHLGHLMFSIPMESTRGPAFFFFSFFLPSYKSKKYVCNTSISSSSSAVVNGNAGLLCFFVLRVDRSQNRNQHILPPWIWSFKSVLLWLLFAFVLILLAFTFAAVGLRKLK